jgi:hypothetical protein
MAVGPKFSVSGNLSDLLYAQEKLGEDVQQQALILAQQHGTIQGVFQSIAALQSTFASWNATVIGVATAVLAAFAIAVAVLTAGYFDNASAVRKVADQVASADVRLGTVETKIDALPERVARQLKPDTIDTPVDSIVPQGAPDREAPRRRR